MPGWSRYTPALALVPDMLEAVDVEDGRIFTLHLRAGHKWSDGQPFTAEDFRYWFEDVARKPQLSPAGLPVALLPNGERPHFEVLDERPSATAGRTPTRCFCRRWPGPTRCTSICPAHYLKQFHQKYADKATLDALVKKAGVRNWAALHNKSGAMYRNDNPDLPSLEPWVLKTKPPADRIVFERNPYYYRVDGAGHQLPYIDRVVFSIANSQDHPGQDRRRRERSAGALSELRRLHLPQGRRGGQRLQGAAVAHRPGQPARALSQPQRRRPGVARSWCATSAFAAPCRSPSTATRSTR